MENAAIDRIASLFAQHGDAVHAYARARAGAALAGDIVSETFIVAWRRRDDLPTPRFPGSWRPRGVWCRRTCAPRSDSRV